MVDGEIGKRAGVRDNDRYATRDGERGDTALARLDVWCHHEARSPQQVVDLGLRYVTIQEVDLRMVGDLNSGRTAAGDH